MGKFKKAFGIVVDNVKYTIGLVIGILYSIYHLFFLKTVTSGKAAVMQLEDSDVSYAVGMNWATGGVTSWLFVLAVLVTVYCSFKLFYVNKSRR